MKKIIALLLVSTLSSIALAQIAPPEGKPVKETKTLLGNGNKVRGYGAIDGHLSEFRGRKALMAGIQGGVIMNNNFILGIGAKGITTNVSFDGTNPTDRLHLYGGYGGFILGAIIAPKEVIHIAFPVLIGAGGAYVTNENHFSNANSTTDIYDEASAFFVVEPGVELEINLTTFFKLGLGVSYRWVDESNLVNATDDDLRGLNTSISFKFGKF